MLDATDRAILAILFKDATMSNRTVAEKVGVSQGTVSNRIKRMEQLEIIESKLDEYYTILETEDLNEKMSRQLKDPENEMMVVKNGKVEVIDVSNILPLDQVLIDFAAAIKKDEPDLDGLRLGAQVVKVLSSCQKYL